MPTCSEIITRAFQKAKITGAGVEPDATEAADAMIELQSMYEQWASGGMFGTIADVQTTTALDAEPNQRITTTGSPVITLPTDREDDDDLPPYDTAFIEVIDTTAQTVTRYLWSDGAWVEITGLVLADDAPLASKGQAGLSACLAMVLADEYGGQVGPSVVRQAALFKHTLALKHGGDAQRTAPDYM